MLVLLLITLLTTTFFASAAYDVAQLAVAPSQFTAMVYCSVMALSALGFYGMRKIYGTAVPLMFYFIHSTIVLWSGLMYVHFIYSTSFAPFVYYMDWIVSTPLIVLALGLTAMIKTQKKEWSYVFMLVVLQVMIIITGLFAQVIGPNQAGLAFFALGNIAMLGVFYLVWGPFMHIAYESGSDLYKKYRMLGLLVIVFWLSYPAIWIMGTPGLQVLSPFVTQLFFTVLPILCKAGFGFLDLYLLNTLDNEIRHEGPSIHISQR